MVRIEVRTLFLQVEFNFRNYLAFCLVSDFVSSTPCLCLTLTCSQGPVFAVIGAWLMYQIQNRDVIANDASENLFQKAIIITALGFILSSLGPIDEWYGLHYFNEVLYRFS